MYLQEDYFDLVDVDSFGSDTSYLGGAIDALKYGGMLYLTSTDGMSAGGELLLLGVSIFSAPSEQPAGSSSSCAAIVLLFSFNTFAPATTAPCVAAACNAEMRSAFLSV